jgi:hypothetical protein
MFDIHNRHAVRLALETIPFVPIKAAYRRPHH